MIQLKQEILKRFHYQIVGESTTLPKIVFLHGLMGFASNWRTLAKELSNEFQVLLFDQRGHGRSEHRTDDYLINDYVEDLVEILDALSWERVYLVGHSMGGRVASAFTYRYPERVHQLAIVDIGPESSKESMRGIEEKLNFVPVPFVSREAAKEFFSGPFVEKYSSELLKQFFYANLATDTKGGLDWKFHKEGILKTLKNSRELDLWPVFRGLQVPTLLMRGQLSEDLPLSQYEEVLATNSNITGVQVAEAGHWVHVQKPKEVLEELREFFKRG